MKRILLLCDLGITTSKLTFKLDKLFKEHNLSYEVIACPVSEVGNKGKEAVILMLSPQVRFNYLKVKDMFPDKVVIKIENEDYAKMNAVKIFEEIIERIK